MNAQNSEDKGFHFFKLVKEFLINFIIESDQKGAENDVNNFSIILLLFSSPIFSFSSFSHLSK